VQVGGNMPSTCLKPSAISILCLAVVILFADGCKKKPGEAKNQTGANAASPTTHTDEPVELKINWPVGGRVAVRMEIVIASETLVPSSPNPIAQDTTLNQEFGITVLKERPEGGRELELQFGAMDLSVMMGGKEVLGFDSRGDAAGDAANPTAAALRALVGAKLKYVLDATNRVERMEGAQELAERVRSSAGGPAQSAIAAMFGEESFKRMVDFGAGFPARPVKPGDSWPIQRDIALGGMGTGVLDLTYTFKGWEQHEKRECARLDYAGTLNSKPDVGGTGAAMGMKMSVHDGKISGQTWYDADLELPVESIINQSLVAVITVAPPANPGPRAPRGGMVITNLMDQKITIMLARENGK
jgi:hypothetical protein